MAHPKFQDSDLRRLMAWFPGAYDLRALLWAHVRVWRSHGIDCVCAFHVPPARGVVFLTSSGGPVSE
jgi:hypothetical protein